ncbi:MAG: hypothetical protein GC159_09470 [Phycisphaera sp.]|nr:hypothetical protein [Phycisphaera sp.]
MDHIEYIVGGVIAVVVIAIVAYYAARMLKGAVRLDLGDRTAFRSNEPIEGRVSLELKKASRGLLKVAVVGEREVRQRRSNSNDTTSWQEFYRSDQVLEDRRDFPAGFTRHYDIDLVAPTASTVGGGVGEAVSDMIDSSSIPDGFKKIARAAVSTASRSYGRTRWKVEVRFDATGVDLYTSRKIGLTLTD